MKHSVRLLIVAVFAAASTGCTVLESGRNAMVESTRMFRPNPLDGPVREEDEEDEWGFVGSEGRADQERQRDPDRWWQNKIMSSEARNIERNLGID